MPKGFAIIISAPSGTGKTTICNSLREIIPDLKFTISHTTRKIREGEIDGVDYIFISKNEFENKIKKNDFLEWAQVHGNYYGTSLESADTTINQGYDTLLEIDIQGVKSLRKMNYQGTYIIIFPPSVKELEVRLRKRGSDSEEKILQRVETGKNEIKKYKMYDYVVTNHVVEDTVNNLISIMQAEKFKIQHYLPNSPDIKILLKDEVD
jgi:guanylate kinase